MTFWKPAIVAAVLAAAGCQPVGAPLGEQRLADKIADVLITEEDISGMAMQQVQGLFQQGLVDRDRASQVGIALGREMKAELPTLKKTLADDLVKEFNIKELEFFHEQLTSDIAKSVNEKAGAAMTNTQQQLATVSQEAATRAIARVNSGWPVPAPAAPPQPTLPPGFELPPGVELPN